MRTGQPPPMRGRVSERGRLVRLVGEHQPRDHCRRLFQQRRDGVRAGVQRIGRSET